MSSPAKLNQSKKSSPSPKRQVPASAEVHATASGVRGDLRAKEVIESPGDLLRQQEQLEQSQAHSRSTIMSSWLSCEQAAIVPAKEVQDVLQVDISLGLDTFEADRRRAKHGLNEINVKTPDPLWKKYLDQFNNPFILLLLASAFISICMGQFDDAISIAFAIVIVVTVGFVQEYQSEKTLERMSSLVPPQCRCVRNREIETIYAKYLVPGDVVHLEVGDRIPADLRLVELNELAVDESSFTGETKPKYKCVELRGNKVNIGVDEMQNIGFQGTLVVNGNGVGVVICTGENSKFGEVFKMMQAAEPPRTPLQKSMDVLGKQLTVYSLGVIALIMIVGWIQGRHLLEMFNVGVSLAVAAIPEGLPIVVTVTLAFGVMRMARKNAVVKRLPTVEGLGCVDWICSDKTGTLTTNEQKVSNFLTPADIESEEHIATVAHRTQNIDLQEFADLVRVGIMCNDAIVNKDQLMGAPIDKALLSFAFEKGFHDERPMFPRISEVPFNSERKFMAVQCSMGQDKVAYFYKGAPEEIVSRCKLIRQGDKSVELSDVHKQKIVSAVNFLSNQEYKRVLAMARSDVNEDNLEFIGLVAFIDPPRPDVHRSIEVLRQSKVRVCMITGDSRETAMSISRLIGLSEDGLTLISGHDVDRMQDRELQDVVDKCYCFYRTTPKHKVRIVKALQQNGHIVAMTGDGVNDGVAIKNADIGISMGIAGTDVCREAADMILLDDDFSTILSAIEEGKCIFYNIRNFVRFQLSTSIAALMLISLSTLLNVPNPLNPMQILWINVIMDGPPAQSLGLEPVDHEVLKRPPRKKKEQILSKALLINIIISASIIIAGTLLVYKETMEDGHMTARETTMTFTCFVFFDMFNALSSRSQERMVYEIGFFSNKYFCFAVALSILGQLAVIYMPPLQYIFQTEALALSDLLMLFCLSSTVFIVCEGKKFLERYYRKAHRKSNLNGNRMNLGNFTV